MFLRFPVKITPDPKFIHRNNAMSLAGQIYGHVDALRTGTIQGWVMDKSDPRSRRTVVARADGKIIAETCADGMRPDLLSQGIGDGRYAFELPVPARLRDGGEIEILDKATGTPLTGSPVRVEGRKGVELSSDAPLFLVDLSDMIFYLEHHDQLTGIQRVQANVFRAFLDELQVPLNRLRVVYFKEEAQAFFEMPVGFIAVLLDDIAAEQADRQFRRREDGRLHLEEQAQPKPLSLKEEEAAHAVFLLLGAAWVFPSYFIALRRLKRNGVKFVALLHDLIPIIIPRLCDKGTAEVFKIFLRRLLRNADHLLTVSENTRRDLIGYCEANGLICPPASVTKNGQSLDLVATRRKTTPVEGDFVLFVSTIEGRKNHDFALRLWENLKTRYGATMPKLVLVGRLGWRVEGFVEALYEKNFLDGTVVLLSDVSDGTLAALYADCLFTIYPSFYEGWGLPVGESLSFGKVCLASQTSAIPEAGGDFAIYFDPASLEDATAKAARLLFDADWRAEREADIRTRFEPIGWGAVAANVRDGVLACAKAPTRFAPPVLDIGEYSFARVSYLEGNMVHGEEVARHLRDFSEPQLLSRRLRLDHYIQAEECLADGIWHAAEDWGRWGHSDGNLLSFRVPDAGKPYLLILKVLLPPQFVPATLLLSSGQGGGLLDSVRITKAAMLLHLETRRFASGDVVRIHFKPKLSGDSHIEGESRKLGLGFSRLALLEADSMAQRLEALERQAYL